MRVGRTGTCSSDCSCILIPRYFDCQCRSNCLSFELFHAIDWSFSQRINDPPRARLGSFCKIILFLPHEVAW